MAFVASDLARVEKAIAAGEMRVKFADGREVEYRSVTDLMGARELIQGEIASTGTAPRARQIRMSSTKGF